MARLTIFNKLKRVFKNAGGGAPTASGARIRIHVDGVGAVTVLEGGTYPDTLIDKIIEVFGAGGAGTLIDEGDGYEFDDTIGELTDMTEGDYLILIYS